MQWASIFFKKLRNVSNSKCLLSVLIDQSNGGGGGGGGGGGRRGSYPKKPKTNLWQFHDEVCFLRVIGFFTKMCRKESSLQIPA